MMENNQHTSHVSPLTSNVTADDALDYFVKRIKEQLGMHLKRIILFGSRARGNETFNSDYDCLIVVDDASEEVKDIIDEVAGDTLYEYNAVFSAFPVSQEKLNHDKYSPLLINISKEGITLYYPNTAV